MVEDSKLVLISMLLKDHIAFNLDSYYTFSKEKRITFTIINNDLL
jgi:hypothetical protein